MNLDCFNLKCLEKKWNVYYHTKPFDTYCKPYINVDKWNGPCTCGDEE